MLALYRKMKYTSRKLAIIRYSGFGWREINKVHALTDLFI